MSEEPKPSSVINLNDHRKDPHLSGQARCLSCGHEWQAVCQVGAVFLECPSCRIYRGVMVFPCEKSAMHWKCGCGNMLFHVTPAGIYCPNCGADQAGF